MWEVLDTQEYRDWRESLPVQAQARLMYLEKLLAVRGPLLGRPHADAVSGSKHPNMKELRPTQTLRGFFAFDAQQRAVLLCGGDKARRGGKRSWYERMIRRADTLFDRHANSG